MNTFFRTILTLCVIFAFLPAKAQNKSLTQVINAPKGMQESISSMIELDADMLKNKLGSGAFLVISQKGDTVASQVTHDSKLIFLRSAVGGDKKTRVKIITDATGNAGNAPKTANSATNSSAKYKPQVHGRVYKERQEDFSMENDRLAYRIYGPETQRRGERIYGYDIFNKRTKEMILDRLYALQCDKDMWKVVSHLRKAGYRELADDVYNYGYCYHVDHGLGMDCYKVGATLGAGTNALLPLSAVEGLSTAQASTTSDDILYPWCYSKAEVLDNGPLRLTVRLTFSPVNISGHEITEQRTLTLDAEAQYVRADIVYNQQDGDSNFPFVPICGIAIHKENAHAYNISKDKKSISYIDLGDPDIYQPRYRAKQDADKGQCTIRCIMPDAVDATFVPFKKETSGAVGHVILRAKEGNKMTYYFGNTWQR